MEMKIVGVTLVAFVSLVVLAAVLMPILDDATETERTFTNEGYFYMTEYETTDSLSISWISTNPGKITVNSVDYDLPQIGDTTTYTVLATDNWILRTNGLTFCQYMDVQGPVVSSVAGVAMTVSASNGSATVTNGTRTETPTYTEMYCISGDTGDYVSIMKKQNVPAYVFGDTPLVAMGRSTIGNNSNVGISIRGDIDDGVTISEFTATGATFGDPTINATPVNGYDDLYLFDSITFTGTLGGSTANLTYNYIIVPSEVTAQKSVQFTAGESELLMVIPVLVIVAILLGVVALIIRSKLD